MMGTTFFAILMTMGTLIKAAPVETKVTDRALVDRASSSLTGVTTTNGWTSQGCYQDGWPHFVPDYFERQSYMTQEYCGKQCYSMGKPYMAVEYGTDCYCASSLTTGNYPKLADSQCNYSCGGNGAENCGGYWTLVLFKYTGTTASTSSSSSAIASSSSASVKASASASVNSVSSSAPASSSASSSASITSASTSSSAIAKSSAAPASSSSSSVVSTSASASSASASSAAASSAVSSSAVSKSSAAASSISSAPVVSSSAASSSAPASSVPASSAAASSVVSSAAASSAPASSVAASIASSAVSSSAPSSTSSAAVVTPTVIAIDPLAVPTPWVAASVPVIAEATYDVKRALTGSSLSSDDMTYTKCLNFCSSGGFALAGLEYGRECYCGNYLTNGASLSLPATATMTCSGANSTSTALCGGPDAITLFYQPTKITGLASDFTTKTATLASGWSAASTPCLQEEVSGRALTGASTSGSDMTVPKCLNYCSSKGFQYGALEYGSECYCGSSLVNGASLSLTSGQCNMACSGDSTTTCGGSNALQIYVNPSLSPVANAVNGFANSGCIQEVAGRALTGASISASNMTVAVCTSYCQSQGFTMAGVEYGQECYCGNSLVNGATTTLTSGQCVMPCAGDSTTICGGPNAINLYTVSA
ncbi:uncharacterized protein L201_000305 [Kwoniella dendrophila CBS 6074]|uniref:WSC domain-containing protein n=1 Tax=Kwoniella dendrophila CBS 6074 TaxID=1295534 RepID=A0AAX4JJ13_9TREE